jgi:hypothetical protein
MVAGSGTCDRSSGSRTGCRSPGGGRGRRANLRRRRREGCGCPGGARLAATTNPGGAGKWRVCYGEPQRGASVAVIPDQDAAADLGRQGQTAARPLHPAPASSPCGDGSTSPPSPRRTCILAPVVRRIDKAEKKAKL